MGWKNWPSWLKGGMVLSIIYLILFLISFLLELMMQPDGFLPLWFLLFPSLLLPFIRDCLFFNPNPSPNCNTTFISIILVILNIVFYFLIGTLVGKIKSRGEAK